MIEDTFRLLRQRPFEEIEEKMRQMGRDLNKKYPGRILTIADSIEWMNEEDMLLHKNGWTRQEYLREYTKRDYLK